MKSLEEIRRARCFLKKLANGVNPLTDEIVADTDLIRNAEISRRLSEIVDLFSQVIDSGNFPVQSAQEEELSKASYQEARKHFEFSALPIPVSEIVKRLHQLPNFPQMAKLNYQFIQEWLINAGLLTTVINDDGKPVKQPTPQGVEAGISIGQCKRRDHVYTIILYGQQAQHLILDHLDAIVALSRLPRAKAATSRRASWTRGADHPFPQTGSAG